MLSPTLAASGAPSAVSRLVLCCRGHLARNFQSWMSILKFCGPCSVSYQIFLYYLSEQHVTHISVVVFFSLSVQIVSDVYLQSHERGRRHQEAVARLPDDHAPLIITLDEENTAGELESKVAQDQLRSGRRRTRKLRQRMAARSASYAEPNFARKLLKHLLLHHYKKYIYKATQTRIKPRTSRSSMHVLIHQ